jgi:hypothetical protein
MHKGWLLGSFAVVAVVAACSSSSTPDPYPDVNAFCSGLADAECTKAAGYCGVDVTACKTARTAKCNSLAAGTASQTAEVDPFTAVTSSRKYTSGSVPDCLNATKSLYDQQAGITAAQFKAQQDKCNLVFQGSGTMSSACTSDFDCSGGLICDKTVCAPKTPGTAMSFCNSPGQTCDDSTYCGAPSGAGNRVCTARPGSGQACSNGGAGTGGGGGGGDGGTGGGGGTSSIAIPCASGFTCANAVCTTAFASGAACTSSEQCATAASLCDPSINKCDSGLLLGGGSAACKYYGGM